MGATRCAGVRQTGQSPDASWDLDFSDLDGVGPLRHEPRQERKRLPAVRGFHPPPHAMSAGQTARRGTAVSQRTGEALPGGERSGVLVRLVLVRSARGGTILEFVFYYQ
jgi:hypothetical protein